jgi:hypothetical protein
VVKCLFELTITAAWWHSLDRLLGKGVKIVRKAD